MSNDAERTSGQIVVGVDGSTSSLEALRWAAKQAELTHAPLWAVATWQYPNVGEAYPYPVGYEYDLAADAREMIERSLNEAVSAEQRAAIDAIVREGSARHVLAELSRNASLVVVGTRGHREVVGFFAGSVGEYLTTHAHCPVVIVRPCDGASTRAT